MYTKSCFAGSSDAAAKSLEYTDLFIFINNKLIKKSSQATNYLFFYLKQGETLHINWLAQSGM